MRLFNIFINSSQRIFIRLFRSLFFRFKKKQDSLYKKFGTIRILLFYSNFFTLKMRLNFIEPIDLKNILDGKIAKRFDFKNKEELSKIFCDLAKKKINVTKNLEKASWCIASQRNSEASIEYLLETIKSLNLKYKTIS